MCFIVNQHSMFYEGSCLKKIVKEYLLSLIAAALLSSLICGFIDKNNDHHAVIKLICGLFISITAVAPLANISIPDISTYIGETSFDAQRYIDDGQNASYESMSSIISENLESYILDVANELGAEIQAVIILDDQLPPSPRSVKITGNISPYAKERIKNVITQQLGISEENQIWT